MHAEERYSDEEPPSMLWGLDPIYSAFARLYIKDILEMKESCQVPGIFFYKLHPIFKVDVLGTVVCKREREDFFCYGVDDGTGVINCLCWKDEQWKDHSAPVDGSKSQVPSRGGFNPAEQLKKLLHSQRCSSHLDIGDLLRVRGPVKMSRGQREIMASTYYKVSDPVLAVQISWMLEVPQLYRKFYDKPFQFPSSVQGSNAADADGDSASSSLLGRATRLLKDFLQEKAVERFRPYDLLELLDPLVSGTPPQTPAPQDPAATPSATPSAAKRLHALSREALQLLQDEGRVFRRVISPDQVYQARENDRELHRATSDVIREDCKRAKYSEKGCHVLHILSGVRLRYSRNVSKAVIELVLRRLECNSEIISTSDNHYAVL
ncbi:CST complex subunit STN1 isoform X2 [Anguilla rostrata]|uniref:CST complex subunit STN1 isoform X2 n=1 Tax=Anguilla rostrata TaxID=7938 RepID=UPI0030D0708D